MLRGISKITGFAIGLFVISCDYLLSTTLSISGNPSTLTINSATAGQQPTSATNNSTTYNATTQSSTTSILGSLNANMPSGVTLKVQLAAPTGATSAGAVAMTTTNQTLVSSIPTFTTATGLKITYTLSATAAASQVASATKTLTLTLQ